MIYIYIFFFLLHIFINTSQPNQDAGVGRAVTPGGTAGGAGTGAGTRSPAPTAAGARQGSLPPHHGAADGGKTPRQSTPSTRKDALNARFLLLLLLPVSAAARNPFPKGGCRT